MEEENPFEFFEHFTPFTRQPVNKLKHTSGDVGQQINKGSPGGASQYPSSASPYDDLSMRPSQGNVHSTSYRQHSFDGGNSSREAMSPNPSYENMSSGSASQGNQFHNMSDRHHSLDDGNSAREFPYVSVGPECFQSSLPSRINNLSQDDEMCDQDNTGYTIQEPYGIDSSYRNDEHQSRPEDYRSVSPPRFNMSMYSDELDCRPVGESNPYKMQGNKSEFENEAISAYKENLCPLNEREQQSQFTDFIKNYMRAHPNSAEQQNSFPTQNSPKGKKNKKSDFSLINVGVGCNDSSSICSEDSSTNSSNGRRKKKTKPQKGSNKNNTPVTEKLGKNKGSAPKATPVTNSFHEQNKERQKIANLCGQRLGSLINCLNTWQNTKISKMNSEKLEQFIKEPRLLLTKIFGQFINLQEEYCSTSLKIETIGLLKGLIEEVSQVEGRVSIPIKNRCKLMLEIIYYIVENLTKLKNNWFDLEKEAIKASKSTGSPASEMLSKNKVAASKAPPVTISSQEQKSTPPVGRKQLHHYLSSLQNYLEVCAQKLKSQTKGECESKHTKFIEMLQDIGKITNKFVEKFPIKNVNYGNKDNLDQIVNLRHLVAETASKLLGHAKIISSKKVPYDEMISLKQNINDILTSLLTLLKALEKFLKNDVLKNSSSDLSEREKQSMRTIINRIQNIASQLEIRSKKLASYHFEKPKDGKLDIPDDMLFEIEQRLNLVMGMLPSSNNHSDLIDVETLNSLHQMFHLCKKNLIEYKLNKKSKSTKTIISQIEMAVSLLKCAVKNVLKTSTTSIPVPSPSTPKDEGQKKVATPIKSQKTTESTPAKTQPNVSQKQTLPQPSSVSVKKALTEVQSKEPPSWRPSESAIVLRPLPKQILFSKNELNIVPKIPQCLPSEINPSSQKTTESTPAKTQPNVSQKQTLPQPSSVSVKKALTEVQSKEPPSWRPSESAIVLRPLPKQILFSKNELNIVPKIPQCLPSEINPSSSETNNTTVHVNPPVQQFVPISQEMFGILTKFMGVLDVFKIFLSPAIKSISAISSAKSARDVIAYLNKKAQTQFESLLKRLNVALNKISETCAGYSNLVSQPDDVKLMETFSSFIQTKIHLIVQFESEIVSMAGNVRFLSCLQENVTSACLTIISRMNWFLPDISCRTEIPTISKITEKLESASIVISEINSEIGSLKFQDLDSSQDFESLSVNECRQYINLLKHELDKVIKVLPPDNLEITSNFIALKELSRLTEALRSCKTSIEKFESHGFKEIVNIVSSSAELERILVAACKSMPKLRPSKEIITRMRADAIAGRLKSAVVSPEPVNMDKSCNQLEQQMSSLTISPTLGNEDINTGKKIVGISPALLRKHVKLQGSVHDVKLRLSSTFIEIKDTVSASGPSDMMNVLNKKLVKQFWKNVEKFIKKFEVPKDELLNSKLRKLRIDGNVIMFEDFVELSNVKLQATLTHLKAVQFETSTGEMETLTLAQSLLASEFQAIKSVLFDYKAFIISQTKEEDDEIRSDALKIMEVLVPLVDKLHLSYEYITNTKLDEVRPNDFQQTKRRKLISLLAKTASELAAFKDKLPPIGLEFSGKFILSEDLESLHFLTNLCLDSIAEFTKISNESLQDIVVFHLDKLKNALETIDQRLIESYPELDDIKKMQTDASSKRLLSNVTEKFDDTKYGSPKTKIVESSTTKNVENSALKNIQVPTTTNVENLTTANVENITTTNVENSVVFNIEKNEKFITSDEKPLTTNNNLSFLNRFFALEFVLSTSLQDLNKLSSISSIIELTDFVNRRTMKYLSASLSTALRIFKYLFSVIKSYEKDQTENLDSLVLAQQTKLLSEIHNLQELINDLPSIGDDYARLNDIKMRSITHINESIEVYDNLKNLEWLNQKFGFNRDLMVTSLKKSSFEEGMVQNVNILNFEAFTSASQGAIEAHIKNKLKMVSCCLDVFGDLFTCSGQIPKQLNERLLEFFSQSKSKVTVELLKKLQNQISLYKNESQQLENIIVTISELISVIKEMKLNYHPIEKPIKKSKKSKNDSQQSPNKSVDKGKRKKKSKGDNEKFKEFKSLDEIIPGMERKLYVKGELRVNRKNVSSAYITDEETGKDVLIAGPAARNKAFDGDEVIVEITGKHDSKDGSSVITSGKVIFIWKEVHSRVVVGKIEQYDSTFAQLVPRDKLVPKVLIAINMLPLEFHKPDWKPTELLYFAEIIEWDYVKFALGRFIGEVGPRGDLLAESKANLIELGLDYNPVPLDLEKYLPPIPYTIPQEEIDKRLDLRNEVIFSIDPETAKDLDDALSIKRLDSQLFEVGVHIADPTFFLEEGTPLDCTVSERATSIYLVDRVIHMLPLRLCMLCSLLPGSDKLSISVIWIMDQEGNIKETKFARSVMRSCAQLSYAHAQDVIEGKPVKLPELHNGVSESTLKQNILDLYSISKFIRKRRFDNGALRIDQTKISFKLNAEYEPMSAQVEVLRDSNRMIEDYMLLANESVAKLLNSQHPKIALLRNHQSPKEEHLQRIADSLKKLDVELDIASAGSLHNSLLKYSRNVETRRIALTSFCVKAMKRATYFCFAPRNTHHYALNLQYYTHFTSPIRRYADMVVHRVLTGILKYTDIPKWDTSYVRRLAAHNNKMKYAAKRAGEMSTEMYRSVYIKKLGHVLSEGIVVFVSPNAIEIKVEEWALTTKVYVKDLEAEVEFFDNDLASYMLINWEHLPESQVQVIQVFTIVKVKLIAGPDNSLLDAELIPPAYKEEGLRCSIS